MAITCVADSEEGRKPLKVRGFSIITHLLSIPYGIYSWITPPLGVIDYNSLIMKLHHFRCLAL